MVNFMNIVHIYILLLAVIRISCSQDYEDEADNYFSIGAHLSADAFSRVFKETVNNALCVSQLQEVLSNSSFTTYELSPLNILRNITSNLESRLRRYEDLTQSLVVSGVRGRRHPSCNSIHDIIAMDSNKTCVIAHGKVGELKADLSVKRSDPAILRHFLFNGNMQLEYPAEFFSTLPLHWKCYLRSRLPQHKNILLLVDAGSLTTDSYVHTVQQTLHHLLDMANEDDHYMVMIISDRTLSVSNAGGFVSINMRSREQLKEFAMTKHLRSPTLHASTNHSFALEQAFTVFGRHNGEGAYIVQYLSRGVLAELSEASVVMENLNRFVQTSKRRIKINTLFIADDKRSHVQWSAEFLERLAAQNFTAYRIPQNETANDSVPLDGRVISGNMVTVSGNPVVCVNLSNLERLLSYDETSAKIMPAVKWSYPQEGIGKRKARLVSVVRSENTAWGPVIVGIDVMQDVLFGEIVHQDTVVLAPPAANMEVFVTNSHGMVLYSTRNEAGLWLWDVDGWPRSSRWLVEDLETDDSGTFEVADTRHGLVNYAFQKTPPYVVIMRWAASLSSTAKVSMMTSLSSQRFPMDHMVWHERHERAYRLSVIVGANPSQVLRRNWIFLTDRLGLIRSNALRTGIREEVGILSDLVRKWNEYSAQSKENFVIRRYAATGRGVVVTYPAAELISSLDIWTQRWFMDALSNPGQLVVTGPKADSQLGDIVTVSQAVLLANESDQPFVVLAVEVAASYLEVMLNDAVSSCVTGRRCILFGQDGSVVFAAHEAKKTAARVDAIERYHMSHMEAAMAGLLVQNRRLITKTQCREPRAVTRTTERFFRMNTSFTRVHTVSCMESEQMGGAVHSETLLVTGTNLFLSMVNTTCNRPAVGTFCPCSVSDRRCLFCARFDAFECECPCQCSSPLWSNRQPQIKGLEEELPMCDRPLSTERIVLREWRDEEECTKLRCSHPLHAGACQSQVGCQWCAFERQGAPRTLASCQPLNQCYHGILGRTVFSIPEPTLVNNEGQLWTGSAPLGPLAAGVMILFSLFILIVYCYRSQVTRLIERRSISDGTPLFARISGGPMDPDQDPTVFREEKVTVQLASFEQDVPEARRAVPTASDHGYSTMTDRNTAEESEYADSAVHERPCAVPVRLKTSPVHAMTSLERSDPNATMSTTTSLITTEVEVHNEPINRRSVVA